MFENDVGVAIFIIMLVAFCAVAVITVTYLLWKSTHCWDLKHRSLEDISNVCGCCIKHLEDIDCSDCPHAKMLEQLCNEISKI